MMTSSAEVLDDLKYSSIQYTIDFFNDVQDQEEPLSAFDDTLNA